MTQYSTVRNLVSSAALALKNRVDEVNRLNVFPVPDGDTGTNMSLTLDAVVNDIAKLPADAPLEDVCKAAAHGSLMGARGNSGVITSQIIRGACEGFLKSNDMAPTARLAISLETATSVAFQAVRKPVEGTILTVIRDMSVAARAAADADVTFEEALDSVVAESYASVRRTPDLLPVLKEAGVVDAGGFGLSIWFNGFASALLGREQVEAPVLGDMQVMTVTPVDDWDDDEYLYCTEFLLFGEGIDRERVHDYIAQRGGSELVVGDSGQYKVHVHTDDPSEILSYALGMGEISEVHIHNMRRQQAERPANQGTPSKESAPHKAIGVVSVASGSGLIEILKSLGVDVVVSGGQTMNPSTQDLMEAASTLNVDKVIFLPNNSNIIMAANAAASVLDIPAAVVPTRSVPEAFAALFMFDQSRDFDELVEEMSAAIDDVKTAEVTTAVKDAKSNVGDIKAGQVIGIIGSKDIEAVGDSVEQVVFDLAKMLVDEDSETLTLLLGEGFSDEEGDAMAKTLKERYDWMEVETHRGEQPLYPILISVE